MDLEKIKEKINSQTGEVIITFGESMQESSDFESKAPFNRLYLHFGRYSANNGISVRVVFDQMEAGQINFARKDDINLWLNTMSDITAEHSFSGRYGESTESLDFTIIQESISLTALYMLISVHIPTNWLLLLPT